MSLKRANSISAHEQPSPRRFQAGVLETGSEVAPLKAVDDVQDTGAGLSQKKTLIDTDDDIEEWGQRAGDTHEETPTKHTHEEIATPVKHDEPIDAHAHEVKHDEPIDAHAREVKATPVKHDEPIDAQALEVMDDGPFDEVAHEEKVKALVREGILEFVPMWWKCVHGAAVYSNQSSQLPRWPDGSKCVECQRAQCGPITWRPGAEPPAM